MTDNQIIEKALRILEERAQYETVEIGSPGAVKDYLRLKLFELEHEEFYCVWLNAQNRVIEFEQVSKGTLTQASVYPREIVKCALAQNSCSVILVHNHPSGSIEPSSADVRLTELLKKALALVDVNVLDHFIVAGGGIVSFAEKGLI